MASNDVPCDVSITALAEFLLRAAKPTSGEQPFAIYDSVDEPCMELVDYAKRIFKYFQCSHESTILGLVYIDRFLAKTPDFTLSHFNVHRLLLASIVVAAKFFDDAFLYNSFYAQVGGVSVQELNSLEFKLLEVIQWRLHVEPEDYERFNKAVLAGFQVEHRDQRTNMRLLCDIEEIPTTAEGKDVRSQKVSNVSSPPLRCARLLRQQRSCRRSLSPAGRHRRLHAVPSAA